MELGDLGKITTAYPAVNSLLGRTCTVLGTLLLSPSAGAVCGTCTPGSLAALAGTATFSSSHWLRRSRIGSGPRAAA